MSSPVRLVHDLNYMFENNSGVMFNCDWLLSNNSKEKSEEMKLEYCNGLWYEGHTVRGLCKVMLFDEEKATHPVSLSSTENSQTG